jgi:hypothetical protein
MKTLYTYCEQAGRRGKDYETKLNYGLSGLNIYTVYGKRYNLFAKAMEVRSVFTAVLTFNIDTKWSSSTSLPSPSSPWKKLPVIIDGWAHGSDRKCLKHISRDS